jgi:HPr kinase/phosphorylase
LPDNNGIVVEDTGKESGSITVEEFLAGVSQILDLEVLQGRHGMENRIRSPRIQKLGMVLAGFAGHIPEDRVHIFGGSEMHFLRSLDPEARAVAIQRLKNHRISCIVITNGMEPPEGSLELSSEVGIPFFRTAASTPSSIAGLIDFLEKRLVPRMTIHGVLLEVFGLGVLLLGPSGIGKSECALELVIKGHRLITDDYVEIARSGIDRLTGSGGKVLQHHIELRGLGIIDIRELFGIPATGTSQGIDLAVRLERWKPDAEYDRLGLDPSTIEFLGVTIPVIDMPVGPGRNIATLVEVAARIQLLRQRGHLPSRIANDE